MSLDTPRPENYNFFKLRQQLLLLELGEDPTADRERQRIPSLDLKLPLETLDWTPWVTPDRNQFIAGGGFGDAFVGKWNNVPESLGEMPQVVVKVMRVDPLPEEPNEKRYRVYIYTMLPRGQMAADVSFSSILGEKFTFGLGSITRISFLSLGSVQTEATQH